MSIKTIPLRSIEEKVENDFPQPSVAWATLAILFLAYVSSFVDRQIIGLLVEPIKADFQISDTDLLAEQ